MVNQIGTLPHFIRVLSNFSCLSQRSFWRKIRFDEQRCPGSRRLLVLLDEEPHSAASNVDSAVTFEVTSTLRQFKKVVTTQQQLKKYPRPMEISFLTTNDSATFEKLNVNSAKKKLSTKQQKKQNSVDSSTIETSYVNSAERHLATLRKNYRRNRLFFKVTSTHRQ